MLYFSVPLTSLRYCAPEVLSDLAFSIRSDVWAFGVVVYELATDGAMPFAGKSSQDVKAAVLAGERLHLPVFWPTALHALEDKCFRFTPSARPTFTEVAGILQEALKAARANGLAESAPTESLPPASQPTLTDQDDNYSDLHRPPSGSMDSPVGNEEAVVFASTSLTKPGQDSLMTESPELSDDGSAADLHSSDHAGGRATSSPLTTGVHAAAHDDKVGLVAPRGLPPDDDPRKPWYANVRNGDPASLRSLILTVGREAPSSLV